MFDARFAVFALVLGGCGSGGTTVKDKVDDDTGTIAPSTGGPQAGTPGTTCAASCGDGVLACTEECDDNNNDAGDGCDEGCRVEQPASCGDGQVDLKNSEQCDDGNLASGDGCDDRCQLEAAVSCGDGNLDLANGELCDDGNQWSGDGCSAACQFELVGQDCGDDYALGLEVCDDGNLVNGDGCNPTCNLTTWTELFIGGPQQQGYSDANGNAARIGGFGVLAADDDYLYYSDGNNRVIRRIDVASALITTIAGDGTQGNTDATNGQMASFGSVEGLATDGVTLWVGDENNHTIRAIDLSCPDQVYDCFAVTTVAGSGNQAYADGVGPAAEFDGLRGVTWYNGMVYLLDENHGTLRQFDPITAQVTTLAGQVNNPGYTDGFGTNAQFQSPRYMASNNSGLLYIADTNGSNIRQYNTGTTEVTTFAGNGIAGYVDGIGTAAQIDRPRGMTSDGTSLYFVEFDADTVRQAVLATAEVTTLAGTGASCYPATCPGYQEDVGTTAQFDAPFSIVFHYPTNALYVVDSGNFVIRKIR